MRALMLLALALAACADFADAEREYCLEHPGVCPIVDAGAPDAGASDGGS